MAADIKSGEFQWTKNYLVNPWREDGLVGLGEYPKLSAYLHSRGTVLMGRNIAKRNPKSWHRTIDRVNLGLLERPLLLLEDMKARPHPVLTPTGYYPHHNLYYIYSDEWDLSALGGLIMSDLVERQISAFCVKMRGGTLRFQAQYLRRVRIPRPTDVPLQLMEELNSAFMARNRSAATQTAEAIYARLGAPVPPKDT